MLGERYLWAAGILPLTAMMGGCNKPENYPDAAQSRSVNMLSLVAHEEPLPPEVVPVTLPQIAYRYTYGFVVPDGMIAATLKSHVAACDRMGPVRCRVVNMSRSENNDDQSGELIVNVDAAKARNFGAELEKAVTGRGGEMSESGISAEDLSKQIIDTDARVKAKALLAQRLTQLLATRQGTTADLVTAERALSEVQEELDGARSQLADMKGRVAMSVVTISYATRPAPSSGFLDPLKAGFSSAGKTLGGSMATLMHVLIAILPWVLALVGGIKLYRKLGGHFPRLRWPWRRKDTIES